MSNTLTNALARLPPVSYPSYYLPKNINIEFPLAVSQHKLYASALKEAGLKLSLITSDETLPDSVFVEDTAIVWNGEALITRMCPDREGEQVGVEKFLRDTFVVSHIPEGATLEGGDVLHIGDTTYVGISSRTNIRGADAVREFMHKFRRKVLTIPVSDCLHLKTGLTYLGNGTLIALPEVFDISLFDVEDVIYTHPRETGPANCLRINDCLLIPQGYPVTAKRLEDFAEKNAVRILPVDISEFEKGEGSLTCLSLLW